jgi:hypothetical protein
MQMNKQKRLLSLLFVLLAEVSLPPILAVAQNEPPAETPPAPAANQPSQTSPQPETDQADTQQTVKQTPAAPGTTARPIKQFIPSETIGADSAVSFPVDI